MRKLIFIVLTILTTTLLADEEAPSTFTRSQIRTLLQQTIELYSSEDQTDLEQAAQNFQALVTDAPEGEMDQDALALAESMAFLKAGQPQKALERLDQIEGFEESKERSQARMMKGNAQRQLSEAAVSSEQWEDATTQMTGAVESYKNALREDSNLVAARQNLELSNKRLQEIIELTPPPPEDQESEDQEENEDDEETSDDQEQQQNQEPGDESDPSDDEQEQDSDPSDPADDQQDPSDQDEPPESEESSEEENADPAGQASEGVDPAEELDAKQAEQLLDAALEQEKRQRRQILQQRVRSIPVEKDW